MYSEYNPHILLTPYIDKYWVSQGSIAGSFSMKILPDGCVDIIFAYGNSAFTRSMTENTPYVVGTITSFNNECFCDVVDMFGIRFKPAGITAFVRAQLFEFTDDKIELSQLNSLFGRDFYLSIPDTDNRFLQITYIENYLLRVLSEVYQMDSRIFHALNIINRYDGGISSIKLAEKVCLSPRQFERKFKCIIGIAPKNYSKIMRFHHAKSYITKNTSMSLSEVAWNCGYYDHSHLIKDFIELSGESPTYFNS